MKTSKMITELQNLLKTEGDLEILDNSYSQFVIFSVVTVKDDDEFPETWDMPKGFKFVHMMTID